MTIYRVLLALLDFVPCILCFLAMLRLQKIFYHQMSKYSFAMLAAGTVMILTAGTLKAVWKLFYYGSEGAIDLFKLNHQMIPIEAMGFVFACLGVVIMVIDFNREDKKDVKLNSFVPFIGFAFLAELLPYVGKDAKDPAFVIYLVLLVLGTLGFFITVSFISFKKKKPLYGILMLIAACLMMAMGALATKLEGDNLWLNFAAEMINTTAQAIFLICVHALEKTDLSNLKALFIKKKA